MIHRIGENTPDNADTHQPLLKLRNVKKYFGGVHALDDVDLDLHTNEVLAIVGDNGAGKSTLIKTISGAHQPDSGDIYFNGHRVTVESPHAARELGIETVYQDLALVDTLDVVENVFLGRTITKYRLFIDRKQMNQRTKGILEKLKISIPKILEPVKNLSGGQRQALALGRAIAFGGQIVILDEPTAALGVRETGQVIELIKNLKRHDVSVILISHNMRDVFEVADRILVLRQGRKIATRRTVETNMDEIVKLITGALDSDKRISS